MPPLPFVLDRVVATPTPKGYSGIESAKKVMALALNSRFAGNVFILQCKGRIAMGDEVKTLQAALDRGAHEFTRLVLNMSEVDRLDSTGIGLLVRYAANLRKRGGDIRLAEPPPFVVTLLELANLSSYLHVYSTEEDAIVSFLKQHSHEKAGEKRGPRVLILDQSADLCAFVRTVLAQHGFDVKTTCSIRDAKILLKVDQVDYILVGAGTPQLSAESAVASLHALAPKAAAYQLGADFRCRDAHEATEELLRIFGPNGPLEAP
jgi:anti-anti-sigma factor